MSEKSGCLILLAALCVLGTIMWWYTAKTPICEVSLPCSEQEKIDCCVVDSPCGYVKRYVIRQ